MAEEVSSLDPKFEAFKQQFVADFPEIAKCPRAMQAYLHRLDAIIERQTTAAGHLMTDELKDLCQVFLMGALFFKQEFGHIAHSEL